LKLNHTPESFFYFRRVPILNSLWRKYIDIGKLG
jgi:hypothetical protein